MSVIRDFQHEVQENNRHAELLPFLDYALADLRDTCEDLQRVIRSAQDTQRYGATGAGRSYLGKASAAAAYALDSVRKAREELR